jgi:hypothetical protein
MQPYLDSYILDLHAYSIHEHHQIPYDRPHILDDDVDVHLHTIQLFTFFSRLVHCERLTGLPASTKRAKIKYRFS